MKRFFILTILIACFVAIAGIQGNAQSAYAKVTVYTNARQDVVGMLYLHKLLPIPASYSWSMYFFFSASEGQTVDGGYMYQKWVLLENFGFPYPAGTLYDMDEIVSGVTVHSDSYAPDRWPEYLTTLPGIDFRSQGGE